MCSAELSDDEDSLTRLPSQLSVGQAQRVVIAMAIMPSNPIAYR